jgi:hypothetical protein
LESSTSGSRCINVKRTAGYLHDVRRSVRDRFGRRLFAASAQRIFGKFAPTTDAPVRYHFSLSTKEDLMFRLTIAAVATALALLGVFVSHVPEADAEDPHLGVIEYEISCMPCHGVEGHGDGRLAPALKTRPADLTKIAKANKGVFPASKVADIIDGRQIVSIHGPREMPVWGDRYRKPIESNEPFARIEQRARRQINALVEYLKTLQEKD